MHGGRPWRERWLPPADIEIFRHRDKETAEPPVKESNALARVQSSRPVGMSAEIQPTYLFLLKDVSPILDPHIHIGWRMSAQIWAHIYSSTQKYCCSAFQDVREIFPCGIISLTININPNLVSCPFSLIVNKSSNLSPCKDGGAAVPSYVHFGHDSCRVLRQLYSGTHDMW